MMMTGTQQEKVQVCEEKNWVKGKRIHKEIIGNRISKRALLPTLPASAILPKKFVLKLDVLLTILEMLHPGSFP